MKNKSKDTTKKTTYMSLDEQDESLVDKNQVGDYRSFVYLLKYASKYKWWMGLSLTIMGAAAVFSIISARIIGNLVEDGLLKKDLEQSMFFALGIIIFEVLAILSSWIGRRVLSKYSSLTIFDIRSDLFDHLQKLPLSYYDKQPQGRIVTRITHDVEGIEEFFTSSLGRLVNASFMAVIAITAMLLTNFKLGIIVSLCMLPAILFVFLSKDLVRKVNRSMSRLSSALNAKISEFLSGVEVIRSFGLEDWSNDEYKKTVNNHLESQLKANLLYGWSRPLVSTLCSLPLVGLIWFGGVQVLAGALSVGVFVAFIKYCERFINPIMMLARELHVIQQAFTSTERVVNFLQEDTEEKVFANSSTTPCKDLDFVGKIEFKKIWMQYGHSEWVLRDLSFSINKGEKIGLIGQTGCGKTTIVSLLSRLYEFQQGDIFIDDVDIRSISRDYLRGQIGFVAQDAIIFKGSIRENLTTDKSMSDEVILEATRKTGFLKAINKSGHSLDSQILEGGENLSAGERQLLSLTRVLLKNPKILILDEATANIDPYFEKIIHSAVDLIMKGRTCLIIAHRLDTLKHCDRIFVFDKGQLVEEGSDTVLYNKKGHYYQLRNAQF